MQSRQVTGLSVLRPQLSACIMAVAKLRSGAEVRGWKTASLGFQLEGSMTLMMMMMMMVTRTEKCRVAQEQRQVRSVTEWSHLSP
jgi:hypothetical protein